MHLEESIYIQLLCKHAACSLCIFVYSLGHAPEDLFDCFVALTVGNQLSLLWGKADFMQGS